MVGFNGLDMMRMKDDKFECVDKAEGLHADLSSGCQVKQIYRFVQFTLFTKTSIHCQH